MGIQKHGAFLAFSPVFAPHLVNLLFDFSVKKGDFSVNVIDLFCLLCYNIFGKGILCFSLAAYAYTTNKNITIY